MSCRLVLLFALAPLAARAAVDPAAGCRAAHAADPEAHIACLEAALQDARRNAEPALATPGAVLPEEHAAAAAAGPATPGEVPGVASAEPAAPTGMGAEQVRAMEQKEAPEEEQVLHIVGTSYNSRGLGTFRTEEGQVWRETTPSPERRRLEPDQKYTARIVRSKFGGYRMHVEGVRWMKTVERIE